MDHRIKMTSSAVERVEKKPWPFKPVNVEVTPDLVKRYFLNNETAMEALVDMNLLTFPYHLEEIIDKHRDDFEDFILSECVPEV